MNLQSIQSPAYRTVAMMVPEEPPGFDGVVLHHLKSRSEIESVLHLREEIDLSAHTSASSNFLSLEKKETSWGLSALSSSMDSS